MYSELILITILCLIHGSQLVIAAVGETDLNDLSEQQHSVVINKCCEENEVMVDNVCRLANKYNQSK